MDSKRVIHFCFIIINVRHIASSHCSGSEFVNPPEDLTLYEGQNAVFTCTVSQFNHGQDSLFWEVNPSNRNGILTEHFDASSQEMMIMITFRSVDRGNQTQQCILYKVVKEELQICHSRIAKLTVMYFPDPDEMQCGPTNVTSLMDQQVLQIWCRAPQGNPPIALFWFIEEDLGVSLIKKPTTAAGNVVLSQDLQVSNALHNKEIRCLASRYEYFPEEELTCAIGPLNIFFKPQISLDPQNITIIPQENQSILLNCFGRANPQEMIYAWSCHPPDLIASGCEGYSSSLNLTLHEDSPLLAMGDIQTVTVKCQASNIVGSSEATTQIQVRRSAANGTSPGPAAEVHCSHLTSAMPSISQITFNTDQPSFFCTLPETSNTFMWDQEIMWYFNGDLVDENITLSVQKIEGETSSILRLKNLSKVDNCKLVVCASVSTACNITYKGKSFFTFDLGNVNDCSQTVYNVSTTVYDFQTENSANETTETRKNYRLMIMMVIIMPIATSSIVIAILTLYKCHQQRQPTRHYQNPSSSPQVSLQIQKHTLKQLPVESEGNFGGMITNPDPIYETPTLSIDQSVPTVHQQNEHVYETSMLDSESQHSRDSFQNCCGSVRSSLSYQSDESISVSTRSTESNGDNSDQEYGNQRVINMKGKKATEFRNLTERERSGLEEEIGSYLPPPLPK